MRQIFRFFRALFVIAIMLPFDDDGNSSPSGGGGSNDSQGDTGVSKEVARHHGREQIKARGDNLDDDKWE